MNTPLSLNQYFFPFVEVAADPEWNDKEGAPHHHFTIGTSVVDDDGKGVYQVVVNITSRPESEEARQPYSIHLLTVGFFQVSQGWPEPLKLLEINGASILYASAREFLITITARGPWPAVTLPTVSFLDLYNQKHGGKEEQAGNSIDDEKNGKNK